jgi:Uma2 family endonuclease
VTIKVPDPANALYQLEDLPFPELAWARQEIIDGNLSLTPLAGVGHQIIVDELAAALRRAAPTELCVLTGVSVLRRTEVDCLLVPDISVVDAETAHQAADSKSAFLQPEDVYLAVEVMSLSSRTADLMIKKMVYADWEIGSYWAVDPESREIHEFGARIGADTWLAQVDLSHIWPSEN